MTAHLKPLNQDLQSEIENKLGTECEEELIYGSKCLNRIELKFPETELFRIRIILSALAYDFKFEKGLPMQAVAFKVYLNSTTEPDYLDSVEFEYQLIINHLNESQHLQFSEYTNTLSKEWDSYLAAALERASNE